MLARLLNSCKMLAVDIGLLAERAWHWWLAEILGMLPARFAGSGRVFAEVAGEDVNFFGPGGALREAAANSAVSLRVPPEAVLRRTLTLPVAARFRLKDILANDLERQSPLDPAAVLFTYRILAIERAAQRLVVSLILVRRDVVTAGIAALESFGLRVRNVSVAGEAGREDRLPAQRNAPRRIERRQGITLGLACLAVFLFGADLFVRAAQQQAVINALSARAAQLDVAAGRAADLRAQIDAMQAQAAFLAARRQAPSFGAILAEITNKLPDGTWLYALNDDGRTMELQGYSANASNLVATLDASKYFTGAQFRAPMTAGPQPDLQQFDLSMSLAP